MLKNKFKNKIYLIFLILLSSQINANNNEIFIKKFIKDYGFKPRDRYTHEYNSALLDKTAVSLDKLEEELANNNFDLAGRIVITGYEEQAFPSYFYRYKKAYINDEAQEKTNAGWTLKLHNIFGFLTGFLFRDLNFYLNHWNNNILEHVNSNDVEMFRVNSKIIHEHAFANTLNILNSTEFEIIKNLKNNNYKNILKELTKFWTLIYTKDAKIGDNKSASTQDILFSIEYANHLIRSNLPFKKWYFGPDITYPIEISLAQQKEATLHAQKFVTIFSKNLEPINNTPTVYIFCSFVDGVGKSTLLGNIKNYFKYGVNIENYDRVDNSSSQLADIFKLKTNVFIADLPAQVSHFTYKPDGYVYVNAQRELEKDIKDNIEIFINENKETLEQEFNKKILFTKNIINLNGYLAPELNNINNPELAFIKNLILIKKEKINNWIAFNFNNNNYLFNKLNTSEIRILTQLSTVQSEGLKNIESEQMLFFEGIRLPLPYNLFMQDLTDKLNNNNIKKVVFVDFTSMYPRSSRENVRINYLIQQMCLLDKNFDPNLSLYRNFVNDSELLYLLNNNYNYQKILNSLKLETKTRLVLLNLIDKQNRTDITGISIPDITNLINSEFLELNNNNINLLNNYAQEKVILEKNKLEKIYGKTKNYLAIQQLSLNNLLYFSSLITDIYANKITDEELNKIWQKPENINAQDIYSYFKLNKECKDEILLTPFIKKLRSYWYKVIANLFNSKIINEDKIELDSKNIIANLVPLFLDYNLNNQEISLISRLYPKHEDKIKKNKNINFIINSFFDLKETHYININNSPYLLDYKQEDTDAGLFNFDNNNFKDKATKESNTKKSAITFIVQKYKQDKPIDNVITTNKLYKKLKDSYIWQREYKKLLKKAKKQAENNKDNNNNNNNNTKKDTRDKNKQKNKKPKLKFINPEQIPTVQLIIRLLATLEMIIKDPNSDIVVRTNNKKDFKAAIKIIEQVTLPKYFGIINEKEMFEDYDSVEPYPNWQYWENLKV
ncbi:MAG: hypothetical protein SZ59_C0001G0203 [candidate division TM6 bacterium GW2011_GWF2_28_16]|nr:MAG: hypothetical protein SZ59_C0001G0203 [candidate division TM6 bacterium GW2011_GWF2_28_16]